MTAIYEADRRGVRPKITWGDCAVEYCARNQDQKQIKNFEKKLNALYPHIGHIEAEKIHRDHPAVKKFLEIKKANGNKNVTLNHFIEAISRVLTAATKWRYDWCDLTWLESAPEFERFSSDKRLPKPITWQNQENLLRNCPPHLADEIIVYVNTGMRDSELNNLSWDHELELPEGVIPGGLAFYIPTKSTIKDKNRERLVLINTVAAEIINRKRGDHPKYVFTYNGRPKKSSNNSGFKRARDRACIDVRIHDLRHAFGSRLREAGVDEETRQELLGHKGKSITTHYSMASLNILFAAVQRITLPPKVEAVLDLDNFRKKRTD
nr:tyrosine-type recombinase/integrase [Sessilibacter corallicola]